MELAKPSLTIQLFALVLLFLPGCQLSNLPPKTTILLNYPLQSTEFIFIGGDEYEAEITIALAEEKIKLRPIAIRKNVKELESPERMVEYKEAGSRYALKISVVHNYAWTCVFSSNHIVDATMSVIDLAENDTVLIIQQKGPDGECPPLTPVWKLLAQELSKNLK